MATRATAAVPVSLPGGKATVASLPQPAPNWVKDPATGRNKPDYDDQRTTKDGVPLWQFDVLMTVQNYGRDSLAPFPVTVASEEAPKVVMGQIITLTNPTGRITGINADGVRAAA